MPASMRNVCLASGLLASGANIPLKLVTNDIEKRLTMGVGGLPHTRPLHVSYAPLVKVLPSLPDSSPSILSYPYHAQHVT